MTSNRKPADTRKLRAEIFALRVAGEKNVDIAAKLGITPPRASKLYHEELTERLLPQDEENDLAVARVKAALRGLMPKAMRGDVQAVQAQLAAEKMLLQLRAAGALDERPGQSDGEVVLSEFERRHAERLARAEASRLTA